MNDLNKVSLSFYRLKVACNYKGIDAVIPETELVATLCFRGKDWDTKYIPCSRGNCPIIDKINDK